MVKNYRKLKVVALSLMLAAVTLSAPSVQAQGILGDLLDDYYEERDQSSRGGVLNRTSYSIDDNVGEGISNYGIGETVPLGSGIVILMGAGLGYVALRKKEDEQ